jgi:glycosyltransferase involved in cell wall biosynthesis
MLVPGLPPMPRPLKLSEHLQRLGWPTCLLAPAGAERGDRRFVGDEWMTGRVIAATSALPSPGQWLSRRMRRRTPHPASTSAAASPARELWALERFTRRLLLWLDTPDEDVGWLPWAIPAALRLVRERPVRAIYATGPPFSVVLAGVLVKRLSRLPLVLDFRDAWTLDESDPLGTLGGRFRAPYGKRRIGVLRFLERRCLQAADRVLFSSRYTMERYAEAYPMIADRSDLLWNGIEAQDFGGPPHHFHAFVFAHVGTLQDFQREHLELWFRAMAIATRLDPAFAETHAFVAGGRSPALDGWLGHVIADLGLTDRVQRAGPLAHGDAMSILKGAGALVLVAGRNRYTRLSKISDYAATRRPVLALADDASETARCVVELGGCVYGGGAAEELALLLLDLFRRGRRSALLDQPFPFECPHPLNWATSAARLAGRLDEITGTMGPR